MSIETNSLALSIALLPEPARAKALNGLTEAQAKLLRYDWRFWGRPSQQPPPGKWRIWLILAGRGFGKSRTGAEWIKLKVQQGARRIALVGETAAEVRDVMIEGQSGILGIYPDDQKPKYEPSKRRVTWPNGAIATSYSGDEPDQLRGPEHDAGWCDETAKWKFVDDAWSNFELGLRLGNHPQAVVTTTPKPLQIIRDMLNDPATVVTRGDTYENLHHLPESYIDRIIRKYEGTRLGRQELHAEILDDVPGALWMRSWFDEPGFRVAKAPDMQKIVVSIDPAVTSGEESDETGIIVAGRGVDGHGYILQDLSCRLSSDGWARRAVEAYQTHKANRLVAEANNGGDLVEKVIRMVDRNVAYRKITASRGKSVRAEPIATLYEQKRVHHVGRFDTLEDQMCCMTRETYDGPGSPDRLDAMVWAMSELFLEGGGTTGSAVNITTFERSNPWNI